MNTNLHPVFTLSVNITLYFASIHINGIFALYDKKGKKILMFRDKQKWGGKTSKLLHNFRSQWNNSEFETILIQVEYLEKKIHSTEMHGLAVYGQLYGQLHCGKLQLKCIMAYA